jgi:pimeloyl-ACP methyl ester carboxylesterase
MTIATMQTTMLAGAPARYLLAGPADAPRVAFLHGGTPGVTPYCGGAHVWGASLAPFLADRRVLAPDLPGSGGTAVAGGGAPTIEAMTRHVAALLEALAFRPCHLVGHDVGGLVALSLAIEAPMLVDSVTIVASAASAPTGDMVQNLTLAYPPPPLWSRQSQAWALERLSLSHLHIDADLLDACVEASAGAPHRAAAEALGGANFRKIFVPGIGKAKSRFFEQCREGSMAVPVQVVWATDDPLTDVEQGLWVFRLVAQRQRAAQFHVVNRAGSFLFREQPVQFHQLVAAFQDGLLRGHNRP